MEASLSYSTSNDTTIDVVAKINNTSIVPTLSPSDHDKLHSKDGSVWYIVVPLLTIGVVVLLTIMVLLFLRKKRLDTLRHRLMPFYNFEPGEEETDWETELLDDEDNSFHNKKGYKSMDYYLNAKRNHLILE